MKLPVLAFDIGGGHSLAALVQDGRVLDRRRVVVRRGTGPAAWLDAASAVATAWRGRFRRAAMVERMPSGLAADLSHRLGYPVSALPEAQAAAWSEHRFGGAPGHEMVFVSAGWTVGGAIVSGGALLRGTHGLAGQLGRIRVEGSRSTVADIAGGGTLLRRAVQHGVHDLAGLLSASSAGARWAVLLLDDAAAALAHAIEAVQLVLDPPLIVLGGEIGTAPGFVDRLHGRLADVTPRPVLQAATAGPDAALLGAADHTASQAGVLALPAR